MKALPVLDPKAAAIDVGGEKLHVSLAGDTPHVFGTFTGELERLRDWFKEQGVTSVALEATGAVRANCWPCATCKSRRRNPTG